MIGNLSELLRVALDTSDQEQVTLREELDFLNRYLEIQQVRFGERLRVTRHIEAATLAAHVPALILQPLVENAIRHGIEPSPGPGTISIAAGRDGEKLHLVVKDSGAGGANAEDHQPGIGLTNTQARLHELYGSDARMLLNTAPEGGWSVDLEIPFRETT
jgi:LytS/YehU family sensor histidine kinase